MTGSPPSAVAPAPSAPTYPEIAHTIRLLEGEPTKRVRDMMNAIFMSSVTPPPPIDWENPDTWFDVPMPADLLALARKLWEGSSKAVNPRHLYVFNQVASRLKLLEPVEGVYRVTERGRRFLAGDQAILRELVTMRSSLRRRDRTSRSPDSDC
jgi:hypothetical protein